MATISEDITNLFLALLVPADLYAICLTSRGLRRLAEPFLYSKIQLTWDTLQTPPILSLLRSVQHRPQLATHVRSLVLAGRAFCHERYNGTVPPIPATEAELNSAATMIEAVDLPQHELWAQAMRRGSMDAAVSLLLTRLTNLRKLRMEPSFCKETQLLGVMFRAALCEPASSGKSEMLNTFQHLQDVSFHHLDDDMRGRHLRNTADVLPLFYLPNAQQVRVSIDTPKQFAWPGANPPISTTLNSLKLSNFREDYLGRILETTPTLQSLTWGWFSKHDIVERTCAPEISLTALTDALCKVRGTIQELKITAFVGRTWDGYDGEYIRTTGSLDALANLKKLERLQVPAPFLLGFEEYIPRHLADILPRSLKQLVITDELRDRDVGQVWGGGDECVFAAIQLFLQGCKVSHPHLRGLELIMHIAPDVWDLNLLNELQVTCTMAGLAFVITRPRKGFVWWGEYGAYDLSYPVTGLWDLD